MLQDKMQRYVEIVVYMYSTKTEKSFQMNVRSLVRSILYLVKNVTYQWRESRKKRRKHKPAHLVTKWLPSGLKATESTQLLWPASVLTSVAFLLQRAPQTHAVEMH